VTIPFHTNARQHATLAKELDAALRRVDLTTDAAQSDTLRVFEDSLTGYCEVEHAVAVGSGTDALTIALAALDAPTGSEVVTCNFGFFATAAAIVRAGLTPVLVDTAPGSFLMDLAAAEKAITERTVAVVAVHLYGQAMDGEALSRFAAKHEITLVEDCAQAVGSRSAGRRVGTFGVASALSFNWSKHLGSVSNGGAVLTNDADIARSARCMRSYGSEGGFRHTRLGMNSKLNPFEAAILEAKLPRLDGWIERRRELAARYRRNLAGSHAVEVPPDHDAEAHVYHKYTIRVDHRDGLRAYLKEQAVGTLVCYPHLLHDQPAFTGHPVRSLGSPNARSLTDSVLSLPIFPELTDDEVDHVSEQILIFLGKAGTDRDGHPAHDGSR